MPSEAVRIDDTESPELDSGVRVLQASDGVAEMRTWLRSLPQDCQDVLRDMNRRRKARHGVE
jgi:hypothetical protein